MTTKTDPFYGLLALNEAAAMWGKSDGTLRTFIRSGKLVEGVDVKKFGKQWVITRAAMERLYGDPPK